MSLFGSKFSGKTLPGCDEPIKVSGIHAVNGRSMLAPFPEGYERIVIGMGCFWGVERLFWQLPGVYVTSVGYVSRDLPPSRDV